MLKEIFDKKYKTIDLKILDVKTLNRAKKNDITFFDSLNYKDFASIGQVREWTFEIERAEIDVTTIGQAPGQYVPFRTYIARFGDGSGTASTYMTNEDSALSNRLVEDVLQRQQVGAAFKLYTDRVFSGGSVSDTLSRSISFDATLTSASFSVNPDDAQEVTVNFRPAGLPTFDLSST